MSSKQISQNQIVEEINLIPVENHQELYQLIHDFRMSLNLRENKTNKIMEFAGSWLDFPEENFNDFNEEIEQRRQASSRRFEF